MPEVKAMTGKERTDVRFRCAFLRRSNGGNMMMTWLDHRSEKWQLIVVSGLHLYRYSRLALLFLF